MGKVFYNKRFSNYLGEDRAILDVVVGNVGLAPSPTPSITASPTPTPSITASQTPTATLTPTPTLTQSPYPICPSQLFYDGGSGSGSGYTGTYERLYTYSGGSFSGAWMEGAYPSLTFHTGAFSGDGRTYAVYGYVSGSTYHTIVFNDASPTIQWYRLFVSTGDYIFNGGILVTGLGLNPAPNDESTDGTYYYPRAQSYGALGYISYPSSCPTPTPTNTTTSTPTPTPTIPQGTSEAYAYLEAVVQAGGTVDSLMSGATITFFQGLYSNSLWDSLYAFYPFMGGTAASHAVEGKLTYTMTWNGGMSHNTDGAVGNGTNGYGNTGFNPDTVIGDGNTSSLGVYVTVLGAVGNRVYDAGANEGTLEQQINIASRRVAGATNEVLFDAGNYFPSGDGRVTSTTTDGTGMTIGTVRSDADRELYRNGSSIATQTNSRTPTYTARNIYFAAQNEGGSPNWYNSNTWGFFFIGKGLDDTEVSTLSTLINNYQTSLARNTY